MINPEWANTISIDLMIRYRQKQSGSDEADLDSVYMYCYLKKTYNVVVPGSG